MCTVLRFISEDGDLYYARNLDLDDRKYGEKIIVTPVGYEMHYKHLPSEKIENAIIGMGIDANNYPLYFEAANEHGLAIANLNFPSNAYFSPEKVEGKDNVTPYELMVWILNHCTTVEEAREAIENQINLINTPFAEHMPVSPVHWMISDKDKSVVVESTKDKGTVVYDDPVDVLTNNPEFPWHMQNLNTYMGLTPNDVTNDKKWDSHNLQRQGVGTGSFGLPGDSTPQSRFVQAAYLNANRPLEKSEGNNVAKAFSIMGSVAMPLGTVINEEGASEFTLYSSCYSQKTKTFYYKTWDNPNVESVKLTAENRTGDKLYTYEKKAFAE